MSEIYIQANKVKNLQNLKRFKYVISYYMDQAKM